MERLTSYEQLAPLLSAQLKRGVYTNHTMGRDAYAAELATGMWAEPFDGGLLILRRRENHDLLTFYLQAGGTLPTLSWERPTITEVVWRPKEQETAETVLEQLHTIGFSELLRRTRRERPGKPMECHDDFPVVTPDGAAAEDFLRQHFDGRTGCIPSVTALQALADAGQLLAVEDDQGLCGLLHYEAAKGATELRHLAVRADCRSRGMAAVLLSHYLQRTAGQKSRVWATQGNVPAERFYEKYGFRPDGWQSAVLLAGGKEPI